MRALITLTWMLTMGVASTLAQPLELKKLHIVMVFDTLDDFLHPSLKIDEWWMRRLWRKTIPPSRHELTILRGESVTRQKVLEQIRETPVGPDEGLLFYFGGHGMVDATKGPFLVLSRGDAATRGERLYRKELREVLEARKAALVVLISDCCSSPVKVEGEATVIARSRDTDRPADALHETVRCLLFQARGTIDITAATDNAAWSDVIKGGLFTRSLHGMMQRPPRMLDADQDGFVSWREFFPQLRGETHNLFKHWRPEMLARGQKVDARTQTPRAFSLGQGQAVVALENATRQVQKYRARWPGQKWVDVVLAPGKTQIHARPLENGEESLPALQVQFDQDEEIHSIAAAESPGTEAPAVSPKVFRIRGVP